MNILRNLFPAESGEGGTVRPLRLQKLFGILLVLWALLPMFAAFGFFGYWFFSAHMGNIWEIGAAHMYQAARFYAKMFFVLGTVTLLAVVVHLTAAPIRNWRETAKQEPWHAVLLFMLLWATISTILSKDPVKQFWGEAFQYDGLFSFYLFGGIYLCAFLYADKQGKLWFLRLFTGVGNLCVLLMLGQVWDHPWVTNVLFHTRSSVFFNLNHFAYYLCLTLLSLTGLYFYDRGRWRSVWYLVSFAFQTYGLLLNNTFGSYLAMLPALPFAYAIYWKSGRKLAWRDALPVVLFLALSVAYALGWIPSNGGTSLIGDFVQTAKDISSISEGAENVADAGHLRYGLWLDAFRLMMERPLFGYGPNGMPPTDGITRPHNTFLQIGAFQGIPSMIAWCAALILLLCAQWKKLDQLEEPTLIAAGAVGAYVASSFFGVPMFYTTSFLFLFLGLASGREPGSALTAAEARRPEGVRPWPAWQRRAVLGAVALVVAAGLLLPTAGLLERAREDRDAENIRNAYTRGYDLIAEEGLTNPGTYWYDPETDTLIPENEPMPKPYGAGTAWKGKTFSLEDTYGLEYDSGRSYRGQVLRVNVNPKSGRVSMVWTAG